MTLRIRHGHASEYHRRGMHAENPRKTRARAYALWVFSLAGLAFLSHAGGQFAWDDVFLVQHNPVLYAPSGIASILTRDLWGPATGQPSQLFHPIPVLSLWAQGCLHGPSIVGFRIGNFLLHILVLVLFHRLLRRRLSVPAALAAVTVAVVGLHPSVTEPVMWITGRHDTVGAAFLLSALLAWPRLGDSWPRALLAGWLAACAFLSKEQFIIAPAVLILFAILEAHAQTRRPPWRLLPLALAGLALALVWRWRLGIALASDQLREGPISLWQAYASIVGHYAAQLFSLRDGVTLSPFSAAGLFSSLCALAVLVALPVLLVFLHRRNRMPWASWLGVAWFFAALLPYVAAIPAIGFYGNRYAYVPLLALATAITGLLSMALPRLPDPKPWIRGLLLFALPLGLAAASFSASSRWSSDLSLYQADVDQQPQNGYAHYHLGYAMVRREGCARALPHFQAATQFAPGYERGWHNLAGCLLNLGLPGEAIPAAQRALALNGASASNHYNLAAAFWGAGQAQQAKAELERALRLQPEHAASQALARRMAAPVGP